MRAALLTIDSLAAGGAVRRFIEARRDDVALVLLSRRFGGRRGGMAAQARRHLRRSGWRFLAYLALNFALYPAVANAGRGLGGRSIARLCRRLRIPLARLADVNAAAARRLLRAHEVDILLSVYFDQILDTGTIRAAARGALNVHPSPLPEYRGPFPLVHMAADGIEEGWVTVHRIVDGAIDAGPVLAQERVPFAADASVLAREQHCFAAGVELLGRVLDDLETLDRTAEAQAAGSYQSFPDRETIARARAQGVRLYTLSDVAART